MSDKYSKEETGISGMLNLAPTDVYGERKEFADTDDELLDLEGLDLGGIDEMPIGDDSSMPDAMPEEEVAVEEDKIQVLKDRLQVVIDNEEVSKEIKTGAEEIAARLEEVEAAIISASEFLAENEATAEEEVPAEEVPAEEVPAEEVPVV